MPKLKKKSYATFWQFSNTVATSRILSTLTLTTLVIHFSINWLTFTKWENLQSCLKDFILQLNFLSLFTFIVIFPPLCSQLYSNNFFMEKVSNIKILFPVEPKKSCRVTYYFFIKPIWDSKCSVTDVTHVKKIMSTPSFFLRYIHNEVLIAFWKFSSLLIVEFRAEKCLSIL